MLDVVPCCGSSLWRKQRALKKAGSLLSWAPLPWWGHSAVRAIPACSSVAVWCVQLARAHDPVFCGAAAVLFKLLLNNRFGFAYLHARRCSPQRLFRGVRAQKKLILGCRRGEFLCVKFRRHCSPLVFHCFTLSVCVIAWSGRRVQCSYVL